MPKVETNRERDKKTFTGLREAGWKPMVVWQCELHELDTTIRRFEGFLRLSVWLAYLLTRRYVE